MTGELVMEQRHGDVWYRVVSTGPFSATYAKASPLDGDWFWWYERTFSGEMAAQDAERAMLDELIGVIHG